MKLSTEMLVKEVHWLLVLETDELDFQKEPHAYASFGIFSQSSFDCEQ